MKAQLNNTEAYRFLNIHMAPTVVKALEENGVKASIPAKKGEINDVVVKMTINEKTISTSPTVYYNGSDSIGLSLHKMMFSKNILTIIDGEIFIVSNEKLLGVWSDPKVVYIEKKSYKDGLGESAQLSRVKIGWIKENSDYSFKLSEALKLDYESKVAMLA